jgi:hypothetical protein
MDEASKPEYAADKKKKQNRTRTESAAENIFG